MTRIASAASSLNTLPAQPDAAVSDRSESPEESLDLVPSMCAICGIDDAEPVGVGQDFEYRTAPDTFLAVRCRRCDLLYLNPRPSEREAARIYPDRYHAFDFTPKSFGFVFKVRRWLKARRLRSWCHGLPANARILDVGCGDGFHLTLLRDYGQPGWQLQGIDADPGAVAAAKVGGLKVDLGKVEELAMPEEPIIWSL